MLAREVERTSGVAVDGGDRPGRAETATAIDISPPTLTRGSNPERVRVFAYVC